MAKFAKTTEIDISAMHEVVEEEAPKKSKWFTIIPIIASILIAFGLWIYITETSTEIHTESFEVEVSNAENETYTIVAKGTYSELADVKKDDISIKKDKDGNYSVTINSSNEDLYNDPNTVEVDDNVVFKFSYNTKNISWSVKSKK